jgi:2-dehydropantoate 2-reductase
LKLAIYGAGAIGSHIAGRLARNGQDVSVIARGVQLAAIQARGITVHAPDATFTVPVRAANDPAELGVQDAVLVTVKAPSLPQVAAGIAPLLGPHTRVVFVLNGVPWWYFDGVSGPLAGTHLPIVDPDGAIRVAVGPARTVGGVVNSACTVVEPGVVQVANARSTLILGMPDGSLPDDVAAIAAALDQPAYGCEVTPTIRDALWAKLFGNLCSGAIVVLANAAPEQAFADPVIEQAARRIVAEAMDLATALGANPKLDLEAMMRALGKMAHRPSILQDLQLGRPMEIDGINTSTLELARLAGVAMPTLEMLVALLRLRARAAGLYGTAD